MNTLELLTRMKNDYWISKTMFGVFARDEIPDCGHPGLYIINTDSSAKKGSHWVLIYVDELCNGYTFESLGPNQWYTPIIENAVHGQCHHMVAEKLQCDLSDVCGEYAFYFARELARGCNIDSVLGPFTRSCLLNDEFIRDYPSEH